MTQDQLVQILVGSGVAGALVLVVAKIVMRVADRMIAAIDRVGTKLDEHTTKDLEHHSQVRESVIALDSKVDTLIGWEDRTPVNSPVMRRTPGGGTPISPGSYGPSRPRTHGGGDR